MEWTLSDESRDSAWGNIYLTCDVKKFIKKIKEEFDEVMLHSKNHKEAVLRFIRIRSHRIDELAGEKLKLKALKIVKGESYDEVLKRLIKLSEEKK